MPHISHSRAEWSTIAGMIATADPGSVPPGLGERIEALLRATPDTWPNEPCVLELEPASIALVERLTAQRSGVADAEQIIRAHQEGNPTASHRIELRSDGVSSVVAYLTDRTNLHRHLRQHATRLTASRTRGELLLIDQQSQKILAVAPLRPEPEGNRKA